MNSDLEQTNRRLEEGKKRFRLSAFRIHEENLSLHSEPMPAGDTSYCSYPAVTRFLDFVKKLLPREKFSTFMSLFRFPLSTAAFCGELKAGVARVFQGSDAYMLSVFDKPEDKVDYDEYRKYKLSINGDWRNEALERSFSSPNSAIVVMTHTEEQERLPEPFYIWVELSDILDYDTEDGTHLDYLLYRETDTTLISVDRGYWTKYEFDVRSGRVVRVIDKKAHGLGYSPARFFWEDSVSLKMKDFKRGVIGHVLSKFDWLLFFSISKQHLDLYAPYPIYSAYAPACDYENEATGEYCDGGYLKDINGDWKFMGGELVKCPKCSEKRVAGPGVFLEIPIPSAANDVADLRNPVQITGVDRGSLDYNHEEAERLRSSIEHMIIGTVSEVSSKEAVSAGQLESSLEAKSRALLRIRHNFQNAQLFIERTVCRLRYGDSFQGIDINYGSEFYTMSVSGYLAKYKEVKEAGVSNGLLDFYFRKVLESATASSPDQIARQRILSKLEPYMHMSESYLNGLIGRGVLNRRNVMLKLDFSRYISRLELDYGNVALYKVSMPEEKRIEELRELLYKYVDEDLKGVDIPETQKVEDMEDEGDDDEEEDNNDNSINNGKGKQKH